MLVIIPGGTPTLKRPGCKSANLNSTHKGDVCSVVQVLFQTEYRASRFTRIFLNKQTSKRYNDVYNTMIE